MNEVMRDGVSVPEPSRAKHLELMFEMNAVRVWELDIATEAAWRNERHDRIFGYDRLLPEWSYERFLDHVMPEDRAAVDRRYGGAIRSNRPWSFECRIRRADGEIRWISATGRPVAGAGADPGKLIGHVIDVTHMKRNEERLGLPVDELNHRVRNTLSVVQAIAARSFQDHVDPAQARRDFMGRIDALAAAHALLSERSWTATTLGDVIDRTLLPYRVQATGTGARFRVSGPEVGLTHRQAVSLTMALNDLATNAAKHGALSIPDGRVELGWTIRPTGTGEEADGAEGAGDRVELLWRESGGPPVERGERTGFGLTLLERVLPGDLGGGVELSFDRGGLTCRIGFRVPPARSSVS